VLNGAGQTAFFGRLTGTGVDSTNDSGIWSEGGGSGLALVAREGDAAPGTAYGVNFSSFDFSFPVLNGAGQTAFRGFLTGSGVDSSNNTGLWATDLNGDLQLIVRAGDLFDVNDDPLIEVLRTVSLVGFFGGIGGEDGRGTGFNDAGQLAFRLGFTDGSQGIFVANLNGASGLLGDFDNSGVLDLPDINLLMDAVRAGTNDPAFDLTGSGTVTLADRDEWVLNLFGSSAIGDVNLDGGVTALGDLSPALANLGQPGPKTWQQGNINDDLVVTALGDLSVILAGLSSEPAAPGSDAAADAALDAPAPNTAVAEYDPSTGVITIRANQVALVAITSDGENLVPGSLTGNFGGLAATDFPNLGEAAWVTSSNILGGVIPGADTVSVSVTPGTPLSDLTLLYQITGNPLTTGVITLIPEPAAFGAAGGRWAGPASPPRNASGRARRPQPSRFLKHQTPNVSETRPTPMSTA
jgi:hypothetical protein